MATTATWGSHAYMLRDAAKGKLIDIPREVLGIDIVSADMWECTRMVFSETVHTQADRSACLTMIVQGLIDVAAQQGATQLILLSRLAMMRSLRQLGFGVQWIGEPNTNDNYGRRYAFCRSRSRGPYRMCLGPRTAAATACSVSMMKRCRARLIGGLAGRDGYAGACLRVRDRPFGARHRSRVRMAAPFCQGEARQKG